MRTKTTPNLAGQVGRFVVFQGRLGHVMGAGLDRASGIPRRWVNLRVMSSHAEAWALVLVGAKADAHAYAGNGRYIRVPDLWQWPVIEHFEDAPKPADGKGYTWKWTGEEFGPVSRLRGGWERVDYAPCSQCYPTWRTVNGKRRNYDGVHPPTWELAECGRCHPGGKCNGKGVCEVE